jgi:hypothetical protein
MRKDGRTDMKKLTAASGNFAKASKMRYVPAVCLKITVLHKNYKTTQTNPVVKITKLLMLNLAAYKKTLGFRISIYRR